ncbi:hypothetical protein GGQ84_001811 [Desulfitispora alkaliphila]|uniref:hypothetical protein n=1 Tax=Desulfitispora alkaliphila TaxID=622674 RepID=UPI003D1E10A2
MNKHNNPACNGCTYDNGNQCLSKVKDKKLNFKKVLDGDTVHFILIECDQRSVKIATS